MRDTLNALKAEIAPVDQGPRFVWVDYADGESHAEAVARTLADNGLTGDEPRLTLISWQCTQRGHATENAGEVA